MVEEGRTGGGGGHFRCNLRGSLASVTNSIDLTAENFHLTVALSSLEFLWCHLTEIRVSSPSSFYSFRIVRTIVWDQQLHHTSSLPPAPGHHEAPRFRFQCLELVRIPQGLLIDLKTDPDSTVISCFAIVILSILGSLFAVRTYNQHEKDGKLTKLQRNHHSVMGLEEDPEDYAAVASSIFIAVAVYAVR